MCYGNEFRKDIVFHTVLLEVDNMKNYFTKLFANEPERIQPKLGEGCFMADFISVILQHMPEPEMLNLVGHLVKKDYTVQLDYMTAWCKAHLDKMIQLKTLIRQSNDQC